MRSHNLKRAFIACADPGGCEVIKRVLPSLKIVLSGYSLALLKLQNSYSGSIASVVDEVVEVNLDPPNLEILFNASNSRDILLCGTSITNEFETQCIKAAARFNILTFSILDHWCHYKKRFTLSENGECILPDYIFVPDKLAYEECVAEGIDGSKLIISGHPVLDYIIRNDMQIDVKSKSNLRISDVKSVLYVAEPIEAANFSNCNTVATDIDIPKYLIGKLKNQLSPTCEFSLLHHPREKNWKYLNLGWDVIDRDGIAKEQIISTSEVVIGVDSIFLIEAALTGKCVMSLSVALGLGKSVGEKLKIVEPLDIAAPLLMENVLNNNKKKLLKVYQHRGAVDRMVHSIVDKINQR